LKFEDGTQEAGALLIGAEGAHSLTREYLIGKEEAQLKSSEIVASFALTALDKDVTLALRNLHPRYCILFHPNGTFAFNSSE
jgi:2-polyprenyl-6-methoxyphenol hydroxylase-like FAD-dependent oxidoreductase